jgi:hypothetical protein
MPIEWYTIRQATVDTPTYRADFVSACIATDQIVNLRLTLRYLGVPFTVKSPLFADNALVVISASIPHSSLKKRHNALSFHRVCEDIAAAIIYLHKIAGRLNPSDILSQHTGYPDAWPILCPLMFWRDFDDTYGKDLPTLQVNGECEDKVKFYGDEVKRE